MKKSPSRLSSRILFQPPSLSYLCKFLVAAMFGLMVTFPALSSEPACETPVAELTGTAQIFEDLWFRAHTPFASRYQTYINSGPFRQSLTNDGSTEAQLTLALTLASAIVEQPCSYDGSCTVIQPSATDFLQALSIVDELAKTRPDDLAHGHWGILLCNKIHQGNDPAIHDCALEYAEKMREQHPEDAAGHLAVAELTLMVNQYEQAQRAMHNAQSARQHATPFGLSVSRQARVMSKHLPGPVFGEPDGIRELAVMTIALTRTLSNQWRSFTLSRYCTETRNFEAQQACLSAADAMVLPGADLVEVSLSLAIQREILKRRTTDARFDRRRAIYRERRDEQARFKNSEMNQHSIDDMVGYFLEVEKKGEYHMLKELGLLPPQCAKIQPEDRVAGR